jgi:glycosyltransferase involved in cell wall biosynthesis
VAEAVDSVLCQTWKNLELIVIDDGSTDNTASIVKAFDDPRVKYHYQENQDAFNALNNGMARAQGDYIAIINSDDVYHCNRFERLIAVMQSEQAACVFSDVAPIDDDSKPLDDPAFGWNHWHQANREFYFAKKGDLYRGFLHGNMMVTTSNLVMTAEALNKVGGFASLRYLHDYDYIFRMMLVYPDGVFYVDDEVLMKYRIHAGNTLSEAAIIGREQDQQVIRKYMLARCPEYLHDLINTGVDRLRTLDRELADVRARLDVKPAKKTATPIESIPTSTLVNTVVKRLRSKVTGAG